MQTKIIKRVLKITWGFVFVIVLAALMSTRAKLLEARDMLAVQFRLHATMGIWMAESNVVLFNEWNRYMQSLLMQYVLHYEVKTIDAYFTLREIREDPENGLSEEQIKQIDIFLSEMQPYLNVGEFNFERLEHDFLVTKLPLFSNTQLWTNTPKARIAVHIEPGDPLREFYIDDPNFFIFPPLESNGCLQVRGAEANPTNIVILQDREQFLEEEANESPPNRGDVFQRSATGEAREKRLPFAEIRGNEIHSHEKHKNAR